MNRQRNSLLVLFALILSWSLALAGVTAILFLAVTARMGG